ncbi:unnamed protein product [Acanthosepion pharaonis]|uniref:Uncharacterized protein n=1 Tax=Acanthosepion pharaonis TaxID=158019 RepID=A0A812BUU3_ACAPH|nr:unnamed protein product [Sepia pharaonis]
MTHPADAYDDFKDAESYDNISRNDDLTETDRQLKKEMVHKVKPLDLKKHFDELEELVSLEVRKDSQELVEEPINNINNNNLKGSESDQEESFPYSDAAADQIEDSEIPSFDQVSEAHPLPIPNLTTENSDEQEKLSPDFDDGILQENLVPTKEDIYKKEQNEFSSLDVLGREEHKSEPIDDLSSSTVLNSPNLCEDSGLGDSIVTSGSEDLDKADDMKSEEGMESLPATPDALSDQNLTLSQKNDAGFEDDEDFQPDELLPEMSQAQLADNGEEFFSENISENMCTALENDKLFAKSRNNVPEKVPSAESSQMSVIGALVVGSQLIASAVLGPSAVCPPALKSPYFNSPLHETQQLMGKPPSPQAFPPAASCVSPGNKQINAETESTEDGAILHPLTTMSEESDSQPSSEALVLDLQSKEFAVENGTVSSQSKDCVTAPQMRVTSISAEANMLEDDVSSFTDCFSTHEAITESLNDLSTDDKYHIQEKVPNDENLTLEAEKVSSVSSSPDDTAINTIKETTEALPTSNKPVK